jgi:alkanesulfonate monooxygenase SsuD/methylene tetrahydromethanopterin reductase-like flavin-dependent oxidoreductase (luciferase family)
MKFGIFYEHQLPRSAGAEWDDDAERRLYQDALDQVELADRIGIDHVWEVEHHFLEEYSHSSAPEVFLAACSQRTRQIRLGHGITLMPPAYNHPARVAERIAALDLVSNGRVEWGTGESATAVEMGGFNIDPADKEDMWREGAEQAANMLAMRPYPGFKGRWFEMPCRNIVPKPAQKPHPPMWVACSRRETIHRAARAGIGALAFSFLEPEQAARWVEDYYAIIKSEECVPIGHTVNPNIAVVTGMSCHRDEAEAIRRGLDGFRFFGYSLGHYALFGEHMPGVTNLWDRFLEVKDRMPDNAGRGGIGTPSQLREHLRRYENVGIEQVIFVQQAGATRHEHICESLETFAAEVMPEFKEREAARAEQKRRELEPFIAAALARKPRMAAIDPSAIPVVAALGRSGGSPLQGAASDRGGAIPIATAELLKERPGLAAAAAAHAATFGNAAKAAK